MIYLVEVTAATDSAGTTEVLRFSSSGYTTKPSDSPANKHYDSRVVTPANISRNLFSSGTTSGESRVGYGVVELSNVDGALDYMLDYGFDGRSLVIKIGDPGDAYSAFTTILSGSMEQVEFTFSKVTILARDKLAILDRPLQTNEYAGNNVLPSGVEGVDDIRGQKKPLVYGNVLNISAIVVNTSKLIYQVSDILINDVSAVYDRGVSLSRHTPDYTDLADMYANQPPAAHYQVLKTSSGSYFRLHSDPDGVITCNVQQGANAAARTVAQIIKLLAIRGGVSSGDINASDVTALDAINNAECGVYVDGADTSLSVIDQIARSIGAWYGFDATGQFRMGQLTIPTSSPDIEIDRTNIISIERSRTSDTDRGVPAYKVTVEYAKNYTVQDVDLAGSVTEVRHNVLREPCASVIATDATIKDKYSLAAELVRTTLLTDVADAEDEADRVLDLYKVKRDLYTVKIALDLTEALPDLNDTARITLNRFGLDSGKYFRIIGIETDYTNNRATLKLWG